MRLRRAGIVVTAAAAVMVGLVPPELSGRTVRRQQSTTSLTLNSVPDGLSVFVSHDSETEDVFLERNLRGKTPLVVRLKPGAYRIGYLMTRVPFVSHLGILDGVPTDGRVAAHLSDGTFLQNTDTLKALSAAKMDFVVPSRFTLERSEDEPLVWDVNDDGELCAFYYRLVGTRIVDAGAIYTEQVTSDVQHVGMVLPAGYLRTEEHAAELRRYYPPQRRFKLTQPPDQVDATLRRGGILQHKQLVLDLLERGGKVIFGGSRAVSVTLEAGTVFLSRQSRGGSVTDLSRTELRDVLTIRDGRLVVKRYGFAVGPT